MCRIADALLEAKDVPLTLPSGSSTSLQDIVKNIMAVNNSLDKLDGYIYLTDSIISALLIIPNESSEGLIKVKKKNIIVYNMIIELL